MFKPSASFQSSMLGSFAYQGILSRHEDHFLVRLLKVVDFSFIPPLLEDCYSEIGRHAYNPVIMIKLLLLQTLYDLSEREVVEQADTNILFRAFVGLSLDDDIPHWTLLGKFRERLSVTRFEEIFNRVVVLAKDVGFLDEKLRILDSTAVKAKVDVARHVGNRGDDDDDSPQRLDHRSPDPEARTGHKSTHVRWYGYKEHVSIDPVSDMVTSVITSSANVSDVTVAVDLVDKELALFPEEERPIRQVTGDKGYVGRAQQFTQRNILDYTIPRENMKQKTGTWFLSARRKRPKI
jgi:IS5 family transposase